MVLLSLIPSLRSDYRSREKALVFWENEESMTEQNQKRASI